MWEEGERSTEDEGLRAQESQLALGKEPAYGSGKKPVEPLFFRKQSCSSMVYRIGRPPEDDAESQLRALP